MIDGTNVQHQSTEGNKDNDKSVAETNIDLYSNSNTNDFPAMEAVRENLENDKEYEVNEEKLKSLDEDQNKLPNIENSIPEPSNDEYELSFDVKKEVDSGNVDVPDGTYKTNISNRYFHRKSIKLKFLVTCLCVIKINCQEMICQIIRYQKLKVKMMKNLEIMRLHHLHPLVPIPLV